MQLAQKLAGYSLGDADLMRRAMGKKKQSEMAKHENQFIDGAVERGIKKKTAKEIFDLMAKFADYGFNRSHSMAYAILAFRTAYLKAQVSAGAQALMIFDTWGGMLTPQNYRELSLASMRTTTSSATTLGSAHGPPPMLNSRRLIVNSPVATELPAASFFTSIGILSALYHRKANGGEGQHVDVCLFDTVIASLSHWLQIYLVNGQTPPRRGTWGNGGMPAGVFRCTDGELMLVVGNDGQFARTCAVLGAPELATDKRFVKNNDRVVHGKEIMAIFAGLFLGFAIKVPMFPFHTWLPDAHTEAPTAGSVILAAVMLKLGAYGFIRFALPLFPEAAQTFAPAIIVLSLIAIIYGAIVAMVQPDLKRLVAYSSVSHMGFVTLGIFVFTEQGLQGAILQMINHGLITGALFLLVGVIYERTHDRTIAKMGGLASRTPVYAAVFGFFAFASAGLPGLSGFVGEFLVLVGTFEVLPGAAAIAAFVMILAAGYLLYMYGRIVFGELSDFLSALGDHLTDMSPIEILTLTPLAILVVVFGIQPGLLLDLIGGTVTSVLAEVQPATAIAVPAEVAFGAALVGLVLGLLGVAGGPGNLHRIVAVYPVEDPPVPLEELPSHPWALEEDSAVTPERPIAAPAASSTRPRATIFGAPKRAISEPVKKLGPYIATMCH